MTNPFFAMLNVRLFALSAIVGREHDPAWKKTFTAVRWCFAAAHSVDDARRIAAEQLTPGNFESPWRDKKLTSVNRVQFEGPMPE
jgi:hypothetical protein